MVLEAIEQLDYHPNAVARSLRARKTHTIAYIASDASPLKMFTASSSAGILTGLLTETKDHGYYLMVHSMVLDEDPRYLRRLLRSGRLDGAVVRVVQDPPYTDALMEMVASTHIPCVCLERAAHPRFGFPSITFDDREAAQKATQLLLNQGHRRIGHLYGDLRFASARLRVEGYEQALRDAGIAADKALIQGGTWESSDAAEAIRKLLLLEQPPTAIFAASDNLAFVAIEILRASGYRIPRDMAVVGFDDIPLASELSPGLTTIRLPLEELGRQAANMVLQLVEGAADLPPDSRILHLDLIRRGTA